mgnify:CR=1 FL=1
MALGTCAVKPYGDGRVELSKMAVTPRAQGRGIGRLLLLEAIDWFRPRPEAVLFLESHRMIAGVLADAGVITVPAEDAVENGLSRVFYPHGLGHFLGLQTHDVAGLIDNEARPIPRPDGHPL